MGPLRFELRSLRPERNRMVQATLRPRSFSCFTCRDTTHQQSLCETEAFFCSSNGLIQVNQGHLSGPHRLLFSVDILPSMWKSLSHM